MLTTQDLEKGLDFTGFIEASGADHNQLIDLAVPRGDSATEGKGIVLWTIDLAPDVPSVPTAGPGGTERWVRYLWLRVPFPGSANKIPKIYAWNEDAPPDLLYFKWLDTAVDITGLETEIATALADAAAAQTTADNANSTAINANNNANTALINANNAATTANNAAVAATTAQADANTALANAAAADAKAVLAQTAATAAQNTANTALAAATNIKTKYARVSERQANGVDAGANIAGDNIRQINTEDTDVSNLVSLAAGKITFAAAGDYRINALSVGFNTSHRLKVVLDATNAILILGHSARNEGVNVNLPSLANGIITVAAPNLTIRLDDWFDGTPGNGLGKAVSSGDAEIYASVEIEKLA